MGSYSLATIKIDQVSPLAIRVSNYYSSKFNLFVVFNELLFIGLYGPYGKTGYGVFNRGVQN